MRHDRRCSNAEDRLEGHVAVRPEQLAPGADAHQAGRPEIRDHALAVHDGRRCGSRVLAVDGDPRGRQPFANPHHASTFPVDRRDCVNPTAARHEHGRGHEPEHGRGQHQSQPYAQHARPRADEHARREARRHGRHGQARSRPSNEIPEVECGAENDGRGDIGGPGRTAFGVAKEATSQQRAAAGGGDGDNAEGCDDGPCLEEEIRHAGDEHDGEPRCRQRKAAPCTRRPRQAVHADRQPSEGCQHAADPRPRRGALELKQPFIDEGEQNERRDRPAGRGTVPSCRRPRKEKEHRQDQERQRQSPAPRMLEHLPSRLRLVRRRHEDLVP